MKDNREKDFLNPWDVGCHPSNSIAVANAKTTKKAETNYSCLRVVPETATVTNLQNDGSRPERGHPQHSRGPPAQNSGHLGDFYPTQAYPTVSVLANPRHRAKTSNPGERSNQIRSEAIRNHLVENNITKTIVHEIVSESLGMRKVCAKLVPK
ncbi:hypothetical protein NQ318_016000, partial [Aromia moschata]